MLFRRYLTPIERPFPPFLTYVAIALLFIVVSCSGDRILVPGMHLSGSVKLSPGSYSFPGHATLDTAILYITGENIELDFAGVVLDARPHLQSPDEFAGIAIHITEARNVTIRNLRVHGYKVALYAENVDSLKLIDCDLSYNYRPRLNSHWDRESLTDWLYYHENENDEWLRYGAAAYLKNCSNALVKGLTVTQGFNGLQLVGCDDGLFYNNDIRFNSGLGIGIYRSSRNRILHNRLDWNVRGYSHGIYQRGQDSAGILLYEQCKNNTIAYNSATHSGDGLFLWAGNQTMDSGEGGCNGNLIYSNDFSQSVANAIEVTFSSNTIINNRLNESRYGIWGGYSYESLIGGNEIRDCEFGIAIEHGNTNTIAHNWFVQCEQGIKLWEREQQPEGWGFAAKRDVRSRDYVITNNIFTSVDSVFAMERTSGIVAWHNNWTDVNEVFADGTDQFDLNSQPVEIDSARQLPQPMADAIDIALDPPEIVGRQYILMNEWGPYNFEYPALFLRAINVSDGGTEYVFGLFGPNGNWKLTGGTGFSSTSLKSGSLPATLVVTRSPKSDRLELQIECVAESHTDQFGNTIPRGSPIDLRYAVFEPDWTWDIRFHTYSAMDSVPLIESVNDLTSSQARASTTIDHSPRFRWWRSPAEGIPSDRFITIAQTVHNFEPGSYMLRLESDDGVRLLLDGREVIRRWDIHEPVIDTITIDLSGQHSIEVQHFDAAGIAVLDLEFELVSLLE